MLFARLAIFVGGCTLEAVEVACNAMGDLPFDVLDGVASLVDKSLLGHLAEEDSASRFGMLETIREYALERLVVSGERDAIARAHAAYFLALAEREEPKIWGSAQRESLAYLAHEHDNLRGALGWTLQAGEAEMAIRLCSALWRFWVRRGYLSEGRRWMEAAFAQATEMPPLLQARALYGAGVLTQQYDHAAAHALFEESLMIWREMEDKEGIALSFNSLGMVARDQGDFATARPLLEKSVKIMREVENKAGLVNAMSDLAVVMRDLVLNQETSSE